MKYFLFAGYACSTNEFGHLGITPMSLYAASEEEAVGIGIKNERKNHPKSSNFYAGFVLVPHISPKTLEQIIDDQSKW